MRFRKLVAAAAVAALAAVTASPASAQNPDEVVAVSVLEGVGFVCNAAGANCTYDLEDPLWNKVTNAHCFSGCQGFFWPGLGPRILRSPVEFAAGPDLKAPDSFCVSTLGGPGCSIHSYSPDGNYGVFPSAVGLGAYCGSSRGRLRSDTRSAQSSVSGRVVRVSYEYTWEQSGATVLPIVGSGIDLDTGKRSTLVGFTSSRGLSGAGDCGISQATTQFQVEGMTVSF
ncbi:MAG TPA: hypothetical protein VNE62_10595 [Actinomycetota bacterium]|nr:hypothetical protein [Actinomycetota bacterium]